MVVQNHSSYKTKGLGASTGALPLPWADDARLLQPSAALTFAAGRECLLGIPSILHPAPSAKVLCRVVSPCRPALAASHTHQNIGAPVGSGQATEQKTQVDDRLQLGPASAGTA